MLLRSLLAWGICCLVFYHPLQAQIKDPFATSVETNSSTKNTIVSNNNTATTTNTTVVAADTLPPKQGLTKHPDFDIFLQSKFKFDPPYITCKDLHDRLESNIEEYTFILDARDAHEYNISHLPNARRIGWSDFSTEKVWMYDRDALVVVYCSIGERSVRMAGFLRKMGFRNVRILYGSITEWANQGYELWDKEQKSTRRIFFTDKSYAKFLKHGSSVFERT